MCPAEDPMPQAEDGGARTVLVVEDEVLLRIAIAEELRARGLTVIEAASGDEARALVLAGVAVDLVLSDITMPGELDGAGLAAWLAVNEFAAPIILTSGLAHALADARTRCPHVRAFVPKPYDQIEIAGCIEKLLAAKP